MGRLRCAGIDTNEKFYQIRKWQKVKREISCLDMCLLKIWWEKFLNISQISQSNFIPGSERRSTCTLRQSEVNRILGKMDELADSEAVNECACLLLAKQ